ncbi:hypothetical protein HMPREF0758_2390 [Serratia odorifera DSM 4582]|uniref:Uncharacterized protein n=1 Tax=Serratia odorifera DSM 4582 TaxID=667129 RepID=D4E2J0_SEROD|nr:hypothetical protein HMPREF0758_2390 [Serratia odorifera DSM 4582]
MNFARSFAGFFIACNAGEMAKYPLFIAQLFSLKNRRFTPIIPPDEAR